MKLYQIAKNTTPLCYLPTGKLVCYQLGDVLVMEEGRVAKRLSVFHNKKERILGHCRYISRLFRIGVRAAWALDEENVLLSVGNTIYELNLSIGELSDGYFCGEGIRPLIFSEVKCISNIEDGIYFGGYLGNRAKDPVSVYKRIDKDLWEKVYSFPQGAINHIHAIVPDRYRDCLWIFTGDFDEASAIWRVNDNFKTVECVCCNDQKYRGCVVFSIPEGLLYATDAPFTNNHLFLLKTDEKFMLYNLKEIAGSCIYGCQWQDKYVFATTVEPDGRETNLFKTFTSRKRGSGIKDDFVHLYIGNMTYGFYDIYKEKKDRLPYAAFQFGVFKFPYGINNTDSLLFQPVATRENDMKLMGLRIN